MRRRLWLAQETPVTYNGPLRANTVLCSLNTTQPSSYKKKTLSALLLSIYAYLAARTYKI